MPTSKHRKTHKKKKSQRRAELDLKRHRTQVFAKKIEEAIKAHQEQEQMNPGIQITGTLEPLEIKPNDFSII